ncbi:MAG: glycosyltransferase [Patescibacteria group bacterium]|jgi:glycosyltransferase involved in cell wall biosynthesis
MKICLINNLYKPFNRGGAEKVSEIIIQGLIKAGHDVFIITTRPRDKELPIADSKLRIYYLNSLYYNLNKLPKFLRFFWQIWNLFNFSGYFKIKKILAAEKCEAVITNNLMGIGFLTPLAVKSLKIKYLHIAHDIQLIHPSGLMYYGEEGMINSFFAKVYSSVCGKLFAPAPAVIFPSRWLKDLYIKRNFFAQAKIEVLPNPVEIVPEQVSKRSGNFIFLFLGQIEKHKGVFLLIDAFNKIKEKYPEVELVLAGDGSRIKQARAKAVKNNNIKFLGWPGESAADKLLGAADCLVYPSLVYENCPNAIQRALVAGLPVLASDLGGIPELLNQNAGILFKPADADSLAEKMIWLIENKNSLGDLAQAGRQKALDFKVEDYIKELGKIIK